MLSPPLPTVRRKVARPDTFTLSEVAAWPPVFTGVVASVAPSPSTENVTLPRPLPTSASTPMSAANVEQRPPKPTSTVPAACAPMPLAYVVPAIVSVRPSPAADSPFDRSRSAGPHPLAEACQDMSLRYVVPGPAGPDGVTRKTTVPCAGTEALIVLEVVWVAPDHRSRSAYEEAAGSPAADAVVEIVVVDEF